MKFRPAFNAFDDLILDNDTNPMNYYQTGEVMKAWNRNVRLFAALILLGLGTLWCQDAKPSPVPADNTKINQRDGNSLEPTADRQKNDKADRALAGKIRKSLVKDKSMSTYAHNLKVIVRDGAVTLKGSVKSEEEKRAAEAKASRIAGAAKVTNEIDVVSK